MDIIGGHKGWHLLPILDWLVQRSKPDSSEMWYQLGGIQIAACEQWTRLLHGLPGLDWTGQDSGREMPYHEDAIATSIIPAARKRPVCMKTRE